MKKGDSSKTSIPHDHFTPPEKNIKTSMHKKHQTPATYLTMVAIHMIILIHGYNSYCFLGTLHQHAYQQIMSERSYCFIHEYWKILFLVWKMAANLQKLCHQQINSLIAIRNLWCKKLSIPYTELRLLWYPCAWMWLLIRPYEEL